MTEVTVLRRINLGNYQHYELSVTITDENENVAMYRALALMVRAFAALGVNEGIDLQKVNV